MLIAFSASFSLPPIFHFFLPFSYFSSFSVAAYSLSALGSAECSARRRERRHNGKTKKENVNNNYYYHQTSANDDEVAIASLTSACLGVCARANNANGRERATRRCLRFSAKQGPRRKNECQETEWRHTRNRQRDASAQIVHLRRKRPAITIYGGRGGGTAEKQHVNGLNSFADYYDCYYPTESKYLRLQK